jgi:hypothetical protein
LNGRFIVQPYSRSFLFRYLGSDISDQSHANGHALPRWQDEPTFINRNVVPRRHDRSRNMTALAAALGGRNRCNEAIAKLRFPSGTGGYILRALKSAWAAAG